MQRKPVPNLYGTAREYYIPGSNDYVVGRTPVICGQSEAQGRKYFKHIGKSGKIWLVADQPNSADNIYVEGKPGSDGFGGATLEFPLTDSEEIIKLKGPWHTNDDALFADTGVDVRDKHYLIVVIGEEVKYGKHYENIVHKVLYKDDEPVLGLFHRGDILGREYAQKLGRRVYVVRSSMGGGCYGYVEPDAIFYWEHPHDPVTASPNQAGIILR